MAIRYSCAQCGLCLHEEILKRSSCNTHFGSSPPTNVSAIKIGNKVFNLILRSDVVNIMTSDLTAGHEICFPTFHFCQQETNMSISFLLFILQYNLGSSGDESFRFKKTFEKITI